jgi:glycosyltransferase involved in cell wall biosynthesis
MNHCRYGDETMMMAGPPVRSGHSDRGAVLLVANYESDVGYAWWLMEQFWRSIADEMAAQGRRCLLAYPVVRSIPPIIANAPLQIRELRVNWAFSLPTLKFLRREKIRTVYLTDWPYVHWIYLLWRLIGVRRIILHDHKPGDRPPARAIKRLLLWAVHASVLPACTGYVGVSEYIGRRLRESACVPARRCRVVENGIELFDESVGREACRRSLGIAADAVLIVMVSRATIYKGLDFAVECVAQLKSTFRQWPRVHILHCGDGPELDRLRTQAKTLGLSAQLQFLGRRTDIRSILCAADIAFHPSRGEGLSLAILEFMCARLPVIVSDRPSVCAPVSDGVTGIVYPRECVDCASEAIVRLVDDADLRRRMGAAAREVVARRFTLGNTLRNFGREVIPDL